MSVTTTEAAATTAPKRHVHKRPVHRRRRPKPVTRAKPKPVITKTATQTTTTSGPPPAVTTIAGTPGTPAYTGPDPEHCLLLANLIDVRTGVEQGVWEGNFVGTSVTDTRAIVFLSGPYTDASEATNYAKSLQGVELAAAGGRWVASAALTSHLQTQVQNTATCMAG